MTREVSFGRAAIVVVPQSLIEQAEREVDAGRAKVFVVYPDGARSEDVVELLRLAIGAAAGEATSRASA